MNPYTCKHTRVVLRKSHSADDRGSAIFRSWSVQATCPACGSPLTLEQVKTAVEHIYSPDIAELVIGAYIGLSSYYEKISALSSNGLDCPITPLDYPEHAS